MTKRVEKIGFQGDVAFLCVDEVPSDAKEKLSANGSHVLAHSETGHHHVVRSEGVQFFETSDPMTCYLRCEGLAQVEHLRPFDTHEALELPPGVWKVRRQREHTPEGWRLVQD